MFTGLVEEMGRLRGRDGGRFTFEAAAVLVDAAIGDSIAVSGCCLTVVALGEGWWSADVVPETLSRTTLGSLSTGDEVNLERPLRLVDRLGGHLVAGHVDGVADVVAAAPDLAVRLAPGLARFVAAKGSIALDGVSLTVASIEVDSLGAVVGVAIVPHTAAVTTLGRRRPGEGVNVEVDLVARYVASLLRD